MWTSPGLILRPCIVELASRKSSSSRGWFKPTSAFKMVIFKNRVRATLRQAALLNSHR